jgi:precorrin-4/cobalt-precorrin-4 C11-methyltransferase
MKVYFVGAGPGDPELLTGKAARLIRGARVCIYAGSLVSPDVLALLPDDAERHDSAGMTLEEIVGVCRSAQASGRDVVRLHSGEPSLYGAIGEQMAALAGCSVEYEVVPGISAFQAAAAALRVELTMPEVAQTVILTRAPGRTPVPPEQELAKLAASRATLCVYLSTDRIAEVCAALEPSYGAECPAALVYHASWPDQRVIRGALSQLAGLVAAAGIRRTAIILVGAALGPAAGAPSRLYNAAFSHGYRKAAEP